MSRRSMIGSGLPVVTGCGGIPLAQSPPPKTPAPPKDTPDRDNEPKVGDRAAVCREFDDGRRVLTRATESRSDFRDYSRAIMVKVRRVCGLLLFSCIYLSAGCGGDPETSKLRVGQRVMLLARFFEEGKEARRLAVTTEGPRGVEYELVATGTEARVVSDPGGDPTRDVVVHVLDGERAGITGTVSRRQCRPVD